MSRKTFEVKTLVERINYFNQKSSDKCSRERLAGCQLLEGVLFDTGNYRGYAELDKEDTTRRLYYYTKK
jgi:hypothetical protein